MSKTTKRDSPSLARVVPRLAPETLHRLIEHRGLDACGELVTAATPEQLASVFDIDLWRRPRPGRDERFDVDRFGEWLEVLVDTGDSIAARTIAGLDTHLVVAGISRYVRVFDPGIFEPTESSDDEPAERNEMMNSESGGEMPDCEIGGYFVRARTTNAWDAIVTLLVTLATEHPHDFHEVMEGCRRLSNSRPEIDGLDDLLMAPEQHLRDVAIDRERRRSRQGYVTSGDARAFLRMARHRCHETTDPGAINPIAAAYFREADEDPDSTPERTPDDDPRSTEAVTALLNEAGLMPNPPRALLEAPDDPGARRLTVLRRLMEFVVRHDEKTYLARSRELAFLANTLVEGASVQSRPFTAREASDAAACICNLGLECWAVQPPDSLLMEQDLVMAFEVGWSVLYRDVSLLVADELVSTLTELECADEDTRRGLRTLLREVAHQRKAGTPWLARDAAEVLATLDVTAWIGVLGLLDECPIVPAALTAVLERRTTPVSPTAFEFISTTAQIGEVRAFMRALPGVLSG